MNETTFERVKPGSNLTRIIKNGNVIDTTVVTPYNVYTSDLRITPEDRLAAKFFAAKLARY